MKLRLLGLFILIAVLILSVTSVSARGKGNNPASLKAAGWHCENVPGLGVHCFPPGTSASSASMTVKVFGTTDPNAEAADYHGTELLIRADLYSDQPCPQEGGDYFGIDFNMDGVTDYFACHHK